jgi:hypothetical protein
VEVVWKWVFEGGLGFTALNYSHSIAPVEKIEWCTGISPLMIRCGSGVEVKMPLLLRFFGVERENVEK